MFIFSIDPSDKQIDKLKSEVSGMEKEKERLYTLYKMREQEEVNMCTSVSLFSHGSV